MKQMTSRQTVLEYYPDALAINIGTNILKKYYHIKKSNGYVLGRGKSKQAAWKAASRNLDN